MRKLRRKTALATRKRLQEAERAHQEVQVAEKPRVAGSKMPSRGVRNILAGVMDRTSSHFQGMRQPIDEYLSGQLETIVARSRWLSANESYMSRFLQMAENSVVGRRGVQLSSRAMREDQKTPDTADRRLLEEVWKDWTRAQNCDVTGKGTFRDIQAIAIRSTFQDGEALVRIVANYENSEHRFALQVLDPMLLDPKLNTTNRTTGNKVRLGIEIDGWGRPVTYWLRQSSATTSSQVLAGKHYRAIPAEEIVHMFRPQLHATQTRGCPAAVTALLRMEMLNGAEEAELTASRVAASKMGAYVSEGGVSHGADGEDDEGNLVEEAEPGMLLNLPAGVRLEMWDPKHPNSSFPEFTKLMLRGAASGLGVSYNSLANDLEGVTYGSLRQSALEEREQWRVLQDFLRDQLCDRIFRAWLPFAILTKKLAVPMTRMQKFLSVEWVGRGFAWLDPGKEQAALKSQILETRTMSRSAALLSQGLDYQEVMEQLSREQEIAASLGVPLETAGPPEPLETPEKEDAEE